MQKNNNFLCNVEKTKDVFIVRTTGYLNETGGDALKQSFEEGFSLGFQKFLINFSGTPVINSLGISKVLEIAEMVVEDRNGKLAFCGLNELTSGVFKMVGLLKMGAAFDSEQETLNFLSH
ncbi:MAG: STAS domain-containing protein [Candidatus Riflebacteria bacterium]|nr:STAS domain-containing protein [Candidatus Riflebacteria bacterium]